MQRKTSDKKQYPFMIISLTKLDIEGTHLKMIKAICDKPTVNIILSGEKLKVFLLTAGMRQGVSLSSLSFIMVEDKPWLISKAKKSAGGGGDPNWKERGKIAIVCRRYDITYRKRFGIALL